MNKQNTELTVTVVMGAAYLYFLYRLYRMSERDTPDFPTKDEILQAVENGASSLTVTPLTQSDN